MLLNSLPSVYAHLVVTIDGREEARDLEYVISRLEQEEQRLELDKEKMSETALLTRGEWKGRASTEQKRTERGEKKAEGGINADPGEVICRYCKGRGHIARGCAKKFADIKEKRHRREDQHVAMMSTLEEQAKKDVWVIDSAASTHMCMTRDLFCRYEAFQEPSTVYLGDNGTISATGSGDIEVELMGGLGSSKGCYMCPC